MPHYHNFGWYYFLKYVVGFAGMLFLYTGFLKEKKITCVCSAQDREIVRRKGENNESCPTGGKTDARAKRDNYTWRRVPADVKSRYSQAPIPTKRHRKPEVNACPRSCKAKCATNNNLQVHRTKSGSPSSSDGDFELQKRQKSRPHCRFESKHRRGLIRNVSSSHSSTNVDCVQVRCRDHRLLDAVERANLQVRNSFAEQEHLELEAFAGFLLKQGSPYFQDTIQSSSSSANRFLPQETSTSNESYSRNSSYDNVEEYKIRCSVPFRTCGKCRPSDSLSTPFASVESRSGTVYLTASSRGKRPEFKISGNRCLRRNEKPERRIQRRRIVGVSKESDEEIVPRENPVNRRRIGIRRGTRYRTCGKCCPSGSLSTPFASVKSRSGTAYLTASSTGKRPDCQISGNRFLRRNEKPERRIQHRRIVGVSKKSDEEIVPRENPVDRRGIGNRRGTRYRSRCN